MVVAGGLSSRMGTDKALIELSGRSLAARAAERLDAVCPEVVVADRGRGVVPDLRSVPDGPGRGPAAGLLGAARAGAGRPLLVLACDLPAVPVALLAELVRRGRAHRADCVLPRTGRGIEPLAGYYGPGALTALEEQVAGGGYALLSLFERDDVRVELIENEELAAFGEPEAMFLNLNAPEDLDRFRS